jgi:hypothetical protein
MASTHPSESASGFFTCHGHTVMNIRRSHDGAIRVAVVGSEVELSHRARFALLGQSIDHLLAVRLGGIGSDRNSTSVVGQGISSAATQVCTRETTITRRWSAWRTAGQSANGDGRSWCRRLGIIPGSVVPLASRSATAFASAD